MRKRTNPEHDCQRIYMTIINRTIKTSERQRPVLAAVYYLLTEMTYPACCGFLYACKRFRVRVGTKHGHEYLQLVDGSSDLHAVGGAVSSVSYIRIIKTSERQRPVLAAV